MKLTKLIPVASIAILAGCSTGADDVAEAEAKHQEALRDADNMVADARQKADDNVIKTQRDVAEDIHSAKTDLNEAAISVNSSSGNFTRATRGGVSP